MNCNWPFLAIFLTISTTLQAQQNQNSKDKTFASILENIISLNKQRVKAMKELTSLQDYHGRPLRTLADDLSLVFVQDDLGQFQDSSEEIFSAEDITNLQPLKLRDANGNTETFYSAKQINALRWSKSCDRATARRCTKACKKAAKTSCADFNCKKKLKRSFNKNCKRECKGHFSRSNSGESE